MTPEYLAALLATLGLPAQRVLALAAGTAVLQVRSAVWGCVATVAGWQPHNKYCITPC